MYKLVLLIFPLASVAWLSLLRSAAVSILIDHSFNFVKLHSLKTVMSCSSELVRFVCFCVVHKVLVYWCITSLKGSAGVGVELGCGWSAGEKFCSSHSMWSKPSAGWPSLPCTHWLKSCIFHVRSVNLAWLLGISLLGWPSASLVLSLSLSGPVFMSSISSMWRWMSLSTGHPAPLWWVAVACLYT